LKQFFENCDTGADALSCRRKKSRNAKRLNALYPFNEAIHDSFIVIHRTSFYHKFLAQLLVGKKKKK